MLKQFFIISLILCAQSMQATDVLRKLISNNDAESISMYIGELDINNPEDRKEAQECLDALTKEIETWRTNSRHAACYDIKSALKDISKAAALYYGSFLVNQFLLSSFNHFGDSYERLTSKDTLKVFFTGIPLAATAYAGMLIYNGGTTYLSSSASTKHMCVLLATRNMLEKFLKEAL